ncbi:BTB/POZ and MATH domain-containing protein 2 [Rhynchospora pubera]|uniref:BTB/POZ and MATH domain-containing protein 2 n=1 Tax=Rhynchospora pubera TaxID=906938 RepID=A0AAV8GS71_9POAL|nr:BTB/POZ and MATH domain-containing protein 2 [Rhynchospora pubera]
MMHFSSSNSDYISIAELDPGYCRFKINYRSLERVMHCSSFYSPKVEVGGVCLSLRYNRSYYYPMAMGVASFDIHFGAFWDFRKTFEISFLGNDGKPVVTASQGGHNHIFPLLVPKMFLEKEALVDGCFFIHCKVPGAVPERPGQELSLSRQLGKLLEDKETTDMSLEVNGEIFYAHRSILGARSPVFKAQLKLKSQLISIEDMETEVFKYLLEYIYTDTINGNPEIPSTSLAQQLLVAANRYGIEGLRIKCEEKLSKDVSLDSVLTCFALAEKHNCSKLKEACFKFATEPANLGNLIFTEEYLQFMQNYPALVSELRSRSGCSEKGAQNIYSIVNKKNSCWT